MADRVHPDDLAVLGQLDRPGHDGDVDRLAGPPAAARVRGPGEADRALPVGQPGDGQPGGGVAPDDPKASARRPVNCAAGRSYRVWKQDTISLPRCPAIRRRPASGEQSRERPVDCVASRLRRPTRPLSSLRRSRRDHRNPGHRCPGRIPALPLSWNISVPVAAATWASSLNRYLAVSATDGERLGNARSLARQQIDAPMSVKYFG